MADYSGHLYNEKGLPLINVKVVAHVASTGTVIATVYTDSTGKWDFGALADIPAIYAYTEFGVRLVLRGEIVGTIGGSVDMVTSGAFRIGATAVLTGDGFYTDYNAGTPRLRVGTVTGGALVKGVYWDGANLAWTGVNTSLTAAGLFTATDAVITGTITASAGSFSGVITIGASGGIFQGTGTFASPTTALKIYNSGGVGLLEMWGSGVKQVYFGTDGALYAGAGNIKLNADGLRLGITAITENRIGWYNGASLVGRISTVYQGGIASLYEEIFGLISTDYAVYDLTLKSGLGAGNQVGGIYIYQDPNQTGSQWIAELNGVEKILIESTTITLAAVPTLPTQTANTIFAGPTAGGAAVPGFRAMVEADVAAHGAAQHTDRTRYIWIPVGDLQLGTGTGGPAKGVYGTWSTMFSAWAFDDAAHEAVIANAIIPADWLSGTITVKYHWTSDTATSGNCVWQFNYIYVSDGGDLKAAVNSRQITEASPATAHYEKVSTITTTVAPTAGQLLKMYFQRRGADAADTMTGDALLIGVSLEYTADS